MSMTFQVNGESDHGSVLVDTGAPHSCISSATVDALGLKRTEPVGIQTVGMADPMYRTLRKGTVDIDVVIRFQNCDRGDIRLHKRFEIMDSAYDFIAGVDLIHFLFEGYPIFPFLIPASILSSTPVIVTSFPSNVQTLQAGTEPASHSVEAIHALDMAAAQFGDIMRADPAKYNTVAATSSMIPSQRMNIGDVLNNVGTNPHSAQFQQAEKNRLTRDTTGASSTPAKGL